MKYFRTVFNQKIEWIVWNTVFTSRIKTALCFGGGAIFSFCIEKNEYSKSAINFP